MLIHQQSIFIRIFLAQMRQNYLDASAIAIFFYLFKKLEALFILPVFKLN